ncbi:MAG: ubiquitin--protein ligase [Planctomycetaceae bacterium]|nr:ubiquitin--protein ligase [Planctomycetaceae bacterium]HAA68320.1 ubiquitin--protein ligase [Planctomycetaceae bacterium]
MNASPRSRRLIADYQTLRKLRAQSSILQFRTQGDPPERYRIRFYGRGLFLDPTSRRVRVLTRHEIGIELGASYPRTLPVLTWKTPVYHPNISLNGLVCLGGYSTQWVPSFKLDELCGMLWDIVRLRNFDIEHPYNREAAEWLRGQDAGRFPVDRRPLRDLASPETPAVCQPPLVTDETWPDSAVVDSNSFSPNGQLGREGLDAEIRFLDFESS